MKDSHPPLEPGTYTSASHQDEAAMSQDQALPNSQEPLNPHVVKGISHYFSLSLHMYWQML